MSTQLTESNKKPSELQKLSHKPIVTYLASGQMNEVAKLLPDTIKEAVKGTPIAVLSKAVDIRAIEAFVAIELTKLKSMVNVDDRLNLQPHQIPLIAKELINQFSTENLADFKICFKNGWMGKYDDKLLRLDAAVITQWMHKYLNEKYTIVETLHKESKEEQDLKLDESGKDWLALWCESVNYRKPIDSREYNNFAMQRAINQRPSDTRKNYIGMLIELGLDVLAAIHVKKNPNDSVYNFEIDGKSIVAKDEEEAREIYIEVYLG